MELADARLYWQKWRWYQRHEQPWARLALHRELARRRAFARGPVHGNVLQLLREGRLELGEHVLFEPHVWLTAETGRITIGAGSVLNVAVMVAALERVEIGAHCLFANGCVVTDADHRYDDLRTPVPWQGYDSDGPTIIGDNVWFGAHAVVTSGVTVGERCVIGANSVVTRDIPPFTVAAGVPARPIREVTYPPDAGDSAQ